MAAPMWRVRELRPDEWWVVDEHSGTAYAVSPETGVRLWARHDLLDKPIPVALRASAPASEPYFADLRFVGMTARYVSGSAPLIEEVASDFGGAMSTLRNSPDVVVELQLDVDVGRLHRSVLGVREGVAVRDLASDTVEPGSSEFPVVPPVQTTAFAGRFCGVHAALLATPAGNVIFCGVRRAGKTTTATLAAREGLATVLTDELVLVGDTGAAFGVALPIRERTLDGRVSYCLRSTVDGAHMVPVDHVVLLASATAAAPAYRRVADVSEALQLSVPHLRALSGPLGRATDNLLKLLRRADVWEWQLRTWPLLLDDIRVGLSGLCAGAA